MGLGEIRTSGSSEFLIQAPDDIGDEIAEAPADAIGELLHAGQPLGKLRIQSCAASQKGRQFVER